MNVVFDHTEDIASGIKSFWFKSDKPVKYIAGQFTEIRLMHDNVDGRGDKRWFTVSSSPTDPLISITTKFTSKFGSSFKQALLKLKPHSKLHLADPMGDFVLPKDKTIPLVFVAGGMGITPMHSMIKWLTDTNEERQIKLIYGVNEFEEMAWPDLFESANIDFMPIITNPPDKWTGLTGSLSAEWILELAEMPSNGLLYLSGPEPMIETFYNRLQELGINKDQLVTDYFPGYTQV